MFLVTERPIAVGSKLQVLLQLADHDSVPKIHIWYFGEVVRARHLLNGWYGMAIAVSEARIHNGPEAEVTTMSS